MGKGAGKGAQQAPMAPETPLVTSDGVSNKVFSREAVSNREDLVIVGNEVYDAKAFRSEHPGGPMFISVFGGRDATEAFMEYHRRAWPKARMAHFKVGDLSPDETPISEPADYIELARLIDPIIAKTRGFAPPIYFAKLAFIIGSTLVLEGAMFLHGATFLQATALGVLYAWIGLNIQHDANHGSISRKPWVNRVLGLFQDYIGGSSILWVQEHVVLHHLHTNDAQLDPDIDGQGIVRLNPADKRHFWHAMQHIVVPVGEAMFAWKILFLDFLEQLTWKFGGHAISELARAPYYWAGVLLKFLFYLRFIIVPLYYTPTLHTAACIATTTMTTSLYLAFFFAISHNFEGVAFVGEEVDGLARDANFMKRQAETSSNVCGPMLAVVNGGLNYQIEHHLFPRVHHSYYPKIAPTVRKYLESKSIKYQHYPTLSSNFVAFVKHLYKMGHTHPKHN